MSVITKNLEKSVKKGKITEDAKNEILSKNNTTTDMNLAKDAILL